MIWICLATKKCRLQNHPMQENGNIHFVGVHIRILSISTSEAEKVKLISKKIRLVVFSL